VSKYFYFIDGLCLFGFIVDIGLCYFLFSYFLNLNYFEWYLRNGANINWLMSLFALIFGDLNKIPFLISSRPFEYVGGWSEIISVIFLHSAAIIVVKRDSNVPITTYWNIDDWLTLIITTVFDILILSWVAVIASIQYFVFIICGAPSRKIISSIEKIEGSETRWFRNSLRENPVAVTAAFSGMVLWTLKLFLLK
jgi:hypothetical protein